MKKAKQYFEDLKKSIDTKNEENINKKIVSIFNEIYTEEIPELIKIRKAKSNSAFKAICREQNQKWNSICNKCQSNGFDILKRDAIKIIVEKEILNGDSL